MLMQRSNMPDQAMLLARAFFYMFYLHMYSSKLGRYVTQLHVSKFIWTILVKLEVWVYQVFMLYFCNLLLIDWIQHVK
jgi:hypothetical protein